ncbi:hypothetical protein [Rhizobium leguminosarum]|uniref:hypothetical protein n=1 Tax=Rhizobium leguminosarum TaxID=384 RepID=UPI001AE144A1|nr:hypothetical protein [Rhizobium leguminosarum]MBP2446387.1 hypothetical protein [Rhizobium leguminosarum]
MAGSFANGLSYATLGNDTQNNMESDAMWLTYPFKVNAALAAMAIPPQTFTSEWRSELQRLGYSSKLTPQETALLMVAHGLGIHYPLDVERAIGVWRHERMIDISKPSVAEALSKMGFSI